MKKIQADSKVVTRPKKLQINFDAGAIATIERLKTASGSSSAADVIRDALGFYDWARKQRQAGLTIGTIRNGKAEAEVILPFDLRGRSECCNT